MKTSSSSSSPKVRTKSKRSQKNNTSLKLPKLPCLSKDLAPFRIDTDYVTAATESCSTVMSEDSTPETYFTSSVSDASSGSRQHPPLSSSSLARPTLQSKQTSYSQSFLNEDESVNSNSSCSWMNLPPRTNWNVTDSSLKPIPPFHPPLVYNTSAYVPEVSPSTVAARISCCLSKRSILADYDDEAASATAYTLEGGIGEDNSCSGVFVIQLYKGGKGPLVKIPVDSTSEFNNEKNTQNFKSNPNEGHFNGATPTSAFSTKSAKSSFSNQSTSIEVRPDFSHGVIVECTRTRGNTISFHRDVQAILASARGESDGVDDWRDPLLGLVTKSRFSFPGFSANSKHRTMYSFDNEEESKEDVTGQLNKLLLPPLRLSRSSKSNIKSKRSDSVQATCSALEKALELIEKDRLDARFLGMQSLVFLTDLRSSRLEKAYMSSLCVLGCPMNFKSYSSTSSVVSSASSFGIRRQEDYDFEDEEESNSATAISRIHERIIWIIMRGGEDETYSKSDNKNSKSNPTPPQLPSSLLYTDDQPQEKTPPFSLNNSFFNESSSSTNPEVLITMRRLAIQVLTNALVVTSNYSDRFPLLPKPQCDALYREDFVQRLALDLIGVIRPPITLLSCAHDAALAARLLGLIACHVEGEVVKEVQGNIEIQGNIAHGSRSSMKKIGDMEVGRPPRKVLDLLERARTAGLSCHGVLEAEARKTFKYLAGSGLEEEKEGRGETC